MQGSGHRGQQGSKSSSQQGTKRQRAEEPSIAAMNSDLQKRVAALEDSLEREQADRQHDQAKMGFLQDKIRSVAERSKNRGSMLIKLLASLRRRENADSALKAAKEDLEAAERELAEMLQQATVMMAEEEGKAAPASQAATAPPSAPQPASQPEAVNHNAAASKPEEGVQGTGQAQHSQVQHNAASGGAGVQNAVGNGPAAGANQSWHEAQQQDAVTSTARLPVTFRIKM